MPRNWHEALECIFSNDIAMYLSVRLTLTTLVESVIRFGTQPWDVYPLDVL